MRRWLAASLGGLTLVWILAGLPALARADEAAPPADQPEAPADATTPEAPAPTAHATFERAQALMTIRTLALSPDQLQGLLPLLQQTVQARQSYQAHAAALWGQSGAALAAAMPAWLSGQAPPVSAADARAALIAASQEQANLESLYDAALQQWANSLAPAQAALIETPGQTQNRQVSEALLAGAASPGDYLASVADLLRGLDPESYTAVKYWEMQRLVGMLASLVPVNNPARASAQLLNMYDALEAMNPGVYQAQRAQLPDAIARQLNLPAAAPAGAAFRLGEVRELFSSDEGLAEVQTLLGQTPPPPATPDDATTAAQQGMAEAVAQWRVGTLVTTLQLTAGQLGQIAPLVGAAGDRRGQLEQSLSAAEQNDQPDLSRLVEELEAEPSLPDDALASWLAIAQPRRALRNSAEQVMTAQLVQIPQFLTQAQLNATDWPRARAGGDNNTQAQELRTVAATITQGRQFLDQFRHLPMRTYEHTKVMRTREFLAGYLPPGSAVSAAAEQPTLNLIAQTKATPDEQWTQGSAQLATELMNGLGALPSMGTSAAPSRQLAWAEVYATLTSPFAGPALVEMTQPAPEQ